jgi:hypothetical protein
LYLRDPMRLAAGSSFTSYSANAFASKSGRIAASVLSKIASNAQRFPCVVMGIENAPI